MARRYAIRTSRRRVNEQMSVLSRQGEQVVGAAREYINLENPTIWSGVFGELPEVIVRIGVGRAWSTVG